MKYIVEGDVDFYKELDDSLNLNLIIDNDDTNKCLITYTELNDHYVELNCGHKFNYGALYKDAFNYKKKFNNMEQIKNKLKINEIRCPYCRKVNDKLLPYYDNLPFPKEHGVNFIDTDKINNDYKNMSNSNNYNSQCQFENILTDESGNTFINKCFSYGYQHFNLKQKYNICNKYCYQHKQVILKELKQKEKDKIKALKQEEKDKIKALKQQEKDKNKALKQQEIESNIEKGSCISILKSGIRKGEVCSINSFKDCLCKRHYNLQILQNKDIKS